MPEENRTQVNRDALRWSAVLHDSHRICDIELNKHRHSIQAGLWVLKNKNQLSDLSESTISAISSIIENHTTYFPDGNSIITDAFSFGQSIPHEFELRILQYADSLGEVRGFFADTPFSHLAQTARSIICHTVNVCEGSHVTIMQYEQQTTQSKVLRSIAEELIRRDRTDVEINSFYQMILLGQYWKLLNE